ncbi:MULTISPECIES: DUF4307 domain-containing protein [Nesterenkonia]|uniref:DUF4307 domain-containing protein n=1 Tax=Nesterenkonia xinjiangensis TaxID=225327 RepID=A0A7Z0GL30_9MICC|nr:MULTISPECIES: DUF4307 domain-containing protein [Nesterenkonia]MDZ5076911.1 DUF4307 domain-containing protein [Nesterenkonia sp. HG001]NYJ77086.1 hypothetical protein [Nesterenkonia xinjiangensis]
MSHSTAPHSLAERYGAPKRPLSSRTRVGLVVGALVAALAVAVYFTVGNTVGQLTSKDVGYIIHSDTSASVDYELTKDFDATVQCMVQVLDDSYAIVGAKTVTIGPHEGSGSADRSQYFRTDVRTEYRGVTGIVDSCWELG